MVSIASISQQIWDMKYRLKAPVNETGVREPIDKTIEDTWRRVATSLAAVERDPAHWEERFYAAIDDFKFLPAGRVVAGAGSSREVTLFNCFVMGAIPDDMGGIFAHLREAALTMQQGGGIGYDFSTLRPRGAEVKGVGADASGPLSFMDVWDALCRTIMSAGYRRGAMMATLRCDHPDIEAFIEAKSDAGRLRMFNLSVLVTDAFMQAVEEGASWELKFGGMVYRAVEARALWDSIMRATYAYAEPGVIFIDRINRLNNLWYCESISSTNPCFAAGTMVKIKRGETITRAEISMLVGETVSVWTGTRWQETMFRVTGQDQPVTRLRLSNGSSLWCTATHNWILADGTRVETRSLPIGAALCLASAAGRDITVAAMEPDGFEPKVYCCSVAGEHSFTVFAGNDEILTGNCGEQPLPAYGACLLGSINLASLVTRPFEAEAALDLDRLKALVPVAEIGNCGEQPLPAYGACLLGSINLASLVTRPFEAEAALDLDRLKALVPVA